MSGSYEQILRERGPLPIEDVLALGVVAGTALHAAHQAGQVHGEVRPAALRRGQPAVDFGDAEPAGDGLAPHASPEALLGQARSALSDVYSLASSLWTLLTGHPPYLPSGGASPDLAAFRDRVLHDPLPPMPAHVPAWLTAELTRALAKRPAQRHPSAQDFADALRRAGAPAPVLAPAVVPLPTPAPAVVPVLAAPPPSDPVPSDPVPSDPVPSDPVPELDQAGWQGIDAGAAAGPATTVAPDTSERDPHRDPVPGPPAARRSDPLVPRPGRVLAGAAGLIVVAAAVSFAALMAARTTRPGPVSSPSVITPATDGAPGDVRLTDNGASVTVSWTDPSRGTVPFLVAGAPVGGSPLPLRDLGRGASSVSYGGLDPHANYCFVVAAVYAVDRVATAPRICTTRPQRRS